MVVNLYFRRKVLKDYKKLSKKNVGFEWRHIWSKDKMAEEVLPYYDKETQSDILAFISDIKQGTFTFLVLLVLIIIGSLAYATFF